MHAAPRRAQRFRLPAALVAAIGVSVAVLAHYRTTSTPQFRDIATAPTGHATVTLRDGTQLVLGPATHLRVPSDFGRSTRTVDLDGEAYFAVVHDSRHPFSVLTHNLQINDVGTEFDVRAYDDEIRVAVARGSVLVGAGRGNGAMGWMGHSIDAGTVSRTRPTFPTQNLAPFQDIPLSAGDIADVVNGVSTVTHHADVADLTSWMQNRLVFDGTPLREVAREIATMFDVQVSVPDSTLAKQLVTASFTDQPVDVVLADVTAILGADFQHTGHTVVIRPRPVGAMRSGNVHRVQLNTASNTAVHMESHE